MAQNKLRVGLVGCGFMGHMHASVYGILPNTELVALYDHREEVAKKFCDKFGAVAESSYESLLAREDLDAIDICLPTFLHAEATIKAANAGKHVLCEKPMALTVDEADAMAAACRDAGVRLMIGHCIRFWPEYAHLKFLNDSGELGQLLSLNLTRFGQFPTWSSENWLADESKAGGGVLDMHIHDTDYALYLLGNPTKMESWGNVDERGPGFVFTTMEYPGNTVVHLEGGWNLPQHSPFKMAFRAIFSKGAALMDGGPMTIYRDGQEPEVVQFEAMKTEGGGNISDLGGYFHEIKYFVDKTLSGEPFEIVTADTSRESLRVTLEEIRQIKAKLT